MIRQRAMGLGLLVLGGVMALLPASGLWGGESKRNDVVRIGVVDSLFRSYPKPMVLAAAQPLRTLLETQTGFKGDVTAAGDADTLGRLLQEEKLDLCVLHGFEFAWIRIKYPELRPLIIAVNGSRQLRAHVLVPKDSQAKGLSHLKGKAIAAPRTNREHCRLFIERACKQCGNEPEQFFSGVSHPSNAEDAIDDLVDGLVPAVIVDGIALECYKQRKPARACRVKEIEKSDVFPAGVIVYRQGGLDDSKLRRLRDGMIAANQTAYGRQLLTLWRLSGFEPVPVDYEQTLVNVLKSYPPK